MKSMILALAILALAVVGCSQELQTSAASQFSASTFEMTTGGNTYPLNGRYALNISSGLYSDSVDVSGSTDVALWVNCTGNYTVLSYQVSPDGSLWVNGSTSMTPCVNNGSRYDTSEKGVRYVRAFAKTGINNPTNTSNLTFIVTMK